MDPARYQLLTDEELIEIARTTEGRQQKQALHQLFARYLGDDAMPKWMRRELGTRMRKTRPTPALVEDCVEAAAEKLCLEVLDGDHSLPEPFEIAVRARCRYAALDALREIGREAQHIQVGDPEYSRPPEEGKPLRPPTSTDDPMIEEAVDDLTFEELIEPLPANDRKLLRLRLLNDASYEEIARVMDLKLPAVRQRTSRALVRLRALIPAPSAARQFPRRQFPPEEVRRGSPFGPVRAATPAGVQRARKLTDRLLS